MLRWQAVKNGNSITVSPCSTRTASYLKNMDKMNIQVWLKKKNGFNKSQTDETNSKEGGKVKSSDREMLLCELSCAEW